MLNDLIALLDLSGNQKVRIEIEKGADNQFNLLIQNIAPVTDAGDDKDAAVQTLKTALTSPLLLSGTAEQLEAGLSESVSEFFSTMQSLSAHLATNLDTLKQQAETAKAKASAAAAKRKTATNRKSTQAKPPAAISDTAATPNIDTKAEPEVKETAPSQPVETPKSEPVAAELF